jgi:hypothetical protein
MSGGERQKTSVIFFFFFFPSIFSRRIRRKKVFAGGREYSNTARARARHGRERLGVFHHFFFLPPVCIDEPPRVKWWKGKKKTKFL